MFKTSITALFILASLASCTDSVTDRLIDDYRGTMICSSPVVSTDTYDDCTVTELSGDRVEINLGLNLSMTATVSEDEALVMEPFSGTLAGGNTVNLPEGVGQFEIDTISGTTTPVKLINIFFTDSLGTDNACILQLVEKT